MVETRKLSMWPSVPAYFGLGNGSRIQLLGVLSMFTNRSIGFSMETAPLSTLSVSNLSTCLQQRLAALDDAVKEVWKENLGEGSGQEKRYLHILAVRPEY